MGQQLCVTKLFGKTLVAKSVFIDTKFQFGASFGGSVNLVLPLGCFLWGLGASFGVPLLVVAAEACLL